MRAVLDLVFDIVIEGIEIIFEAILKCFLRKLTLILNGCIVTEKFIYVTYYYTEGTYCYIVSYRKRPVRDLINARIAVTGMKKRDFFIQSCLYQKILVKGNVRSFSTIMDTLRDLTEKIDKTPNLENLDPMDAERLLTILQIMDNIYGRKP